MFNIKNYTFLKNEENLCHKSSIKDMENNQRQFTKSLEESMNEKTSILNESNEHSNYCY